MVVANTPARSELPIVTRSPSVSIAPPSIPTGKDASIPIEKVAYHDFPNTSREKKLSADEAEKTAPKNKDLDAAQIVLDKRRAEINLLLTEIARLKLVIEKLKQTEKWYLKEGEKLTKFANEKSADNHLYLDKLRAVVAVADLRREIKSKWKQFMDNDLNNYYSEDMKALRALKDEFKAFILTLSESPSEKELEKKADFEKKLFRLKLSVGNIKSNHYDQIFKKFQDSDEYKALEKRYNAALKSRDNIKLDTVKEKSLKNFVEVCDAGDQRTKEIRKYRDELREKINLVERLNVQIKTDEAIVRRLQTKQRDKKELAASSLGKKDDGADKSSRKSKVLLAILVSVGGVGLLALIFGVVLIFQRRKKVILTPLTTSQTYSVHA